MIEFLEHEIVAVDEVDCSDSFFGCHIMFGGRVDWWKAPVDNK
jgi:hypothetical protein